VIPRPAAAAITRIALDHTQLLGPTLIDVAREKAGIAKAGLEIVLGAMPEEIFAAIAQVARAAGGSTRRTEHDDEAAQCVHNTTIGLAGAHQQGNARVAYRLGRSIGASATACADGLARVRWPGRLEMIASADGAVLLDAAHNPDGAEALAAHLRTLGEAPRALLFGALADKEWPPMLDALAPLAAHRVYVEPRGRAATPVASLRARHDGQAAESVSAGYARARAAVGPRGLVVACGSIFLIAELRATLLGLPRDPPIAL